MEKLYDVLEVSRKASKEIIEKSYKTLAKRYHPDLQSVENKSHAEEMMKKINEAYETLSNDEKRREYDRKLEEEEKIQEESRINNSTREVQNTNYNSNFNYSNLNYENANSYQNKNSDEDEWREKFSRLSKKDQERIMKNIQREANAEYRKLYTDYFRSLGFKIKHRWTFKDFLVIFFVILILIFIIYILWLIPPTREVLENLYADNFAIRLVVDLVKGIFQGIGKFFKNITKFLNV